jgi:hypothetical protein
MYIIAPCHKKCPIFLLFQRQTTDSFCGREHTLSANACSYGVQNTDVRTHYCAAGFGRFQKCHECDNEVSATLTEVFCGFPLFYQANVEVVPIYRPQPTTFLHPSTQFYSYPCSCEPKGCWAPMVYGPRTFPGNLSSLTVAMCLN